MLFLRQKRGDYLRFEAFNRSMAMTLTQLERYMISEVENLHLKMDDIFTKVMNQLAYLTNAVDRIERRLDEHEKQFDRIETQFDSIETRLTSIEVATSR